ncbi:MAG TPA: CoB--CoM heterodisulfide reductase iron-sulfur subunit B family protein [Candidatus Kapabacteria bacterium]|jgi:heterodisulfide reductase subunit B|nr:CoB--CoM heterodisulfide reductase iron-sulfur subunit B family protein [Candidatus Kapabacteria bacterium]HOQ48447.1 CoB--CoM heterodisulfide reductase iron-sulfur subunit B family protein [Candidatus Kapabacteria bacterium]HPP40670.1 CoB--CoM heterodisulfide reductase iron-sulfur subunit B family protein [Candidatus Kapabacteria bacterium]HPU23409.1 CoB--CoM heterodisulfide reductase iron-sulfur subunit B family protein [Candidatus Kapabacteria bacterium]
MTKIGYFPGCSLNGTAKEYDLSLKAIARFADVELVELNDWNCCGATAAHSLNSTLAVALPARNLAIAERMGFDEILVPCAACYSRLAQALYEIKSDEKYRTKIPQLIEMEIKGTANPITVLDFINKYVLDKIKDKLTNKLNAKFACYYGCLLTRPEHLSTIERREDPLVMEQIVKLAGGIAIDWAFKVECCGAGLSVVRTDIVGKLCAKIVDDASSRGADAIVVACPMCHSNLDMRRSEINKNLSTDNKIPAIYITQLLGLALGIEPNKLGFDKHFVPADNFIQKLQKQTVEV